MDVDNIGIGIIIKNSLTGKYLLVEERNTNEKTNKFVGELSIIVGHIKTGETLIEATLREIDEELDGSFGIEVNHLLGLVHYLKGDVVVLFYATTDKEDLGRGKWFSIEEIIKLDNLRFSNLEIIEKYHNGELLSTDAIYTS